MWLLFSLLSAIELILMRSADLLDKIEGKLRVISVRVFVYKNDLTLGTNNSKKEISHANRKSTVQPARRGPGISRRSKGK
jgi:hypothetical protein